MIRNVFLDRDGTVIEERHYLRDPSQVALLPGAGQALRDLSTRGCRLFLVSNQSGIGRGYFDASDHSAVQSRLRHLLDACGVRLDGEAFCPHAPEEGCACRKPETGLWTDLAGIHGLDPAASVVVGDKSSDMAFGRRCGFLASILVLTGHGSLEADALGLPELSGDWMELPPGDHPGWPDVLARDLAAACAWIARRCPGQAPGDR